jgi:hypothetical protein
MHYTKALKIRFPLMALLTLLLLLILSQIQISCNKVDQHASLIENQPFIATEIGLSGLFNIKQYDYQDKFVVGDTATLVGKLYLDHPDTRIILGNVTVSIIVKAKVRNGSANTMTGKMDSLDVCRFIITKDMAGNNLPLTLYANGYTVQGPPVTVLLINIGNRLTDTTLVVDKLGTWLPANAAAFKTNPSNSFINNASVAGDGTIYFDNINGVFRLTGGTVSSIVVPGGALIDQSQHSFTIKVILSSVISTDGNTLYFSSLDSEPVAPAADTLYIARLCSLDMQTNQLTTLNRSTVRKDLGTYTEDPGPYNGGIGAMKIVANYLSMDINGNLYFSNFYFPENSGQNPVTGDQYNSTSNWYQYLIAANNNNMTNITGILGNISKLDTKGQMTSLAQTNDNLAYGFTFYTTPGPVLSDIFNNFVPSPDGTLIYGWKNPPRGSDGSLNQYDQTQQDIENLYSAYDDTWLFLSYDSSISTKRVSTSHFNAPRTGNNGEFWNYLLLPNNDILYADPFIGDITSSLYAYDMSNKTVYCYAGTEIENRNLQTNDTGNAKFVNFKGWSLHFCGLDREGSVYYCIGGTADGSLEVDNDYVNGVQFYKLHRRGN